MQKYNPGIDIQLISSLGTIQTMQDSGDKPIGGITALRQKLMNCKESTNSKSVIVLRVSAENKDFLTKDHNKENHFVRLYITKSTGNINIIYIDPMGDKMGESIQQALNDIQGVTTNIHFPPNSGKKIQIYKNPLKMQVDEKKQ